MKIRYVIAPIAILAVLAAFSIPASATCPCVTIDTDTINGSIFYETREVFPGDGGGGGNYWAERTFTVPGNVKIARVHTGVWMLGSGNVEITVNGVSSGPRSASGTCDCNAINDSDMHDYCTGCGVHFITYDATGDIPVGGGDVTVKVESTNADDGRLYTIALLVVYENESMANMTYWINEGAWYIGAGPGYVYFNGTYPPGVTDVTYWTLGMPHGIQIHPDLNGHYIGNPDYHEGDVYDFWRWDNINTDWLDPASNLMYYSGPGGWERVDAAVFRLWRQPPELPDLIVEDIEFPEMMRPGTSYTINATVKNQGIGGTGGTFNVSLEVDSYSDKVTGVGPLDAGKSTTVSFTNVNLGEDCHNFTVVADCDDNVGESDESNNAKSELHQVGYVIVVRSNSDFDNLVTEGLARKVGDTYYIEDLTITNCAGCGITIENTTSPFVIDNCTVQNCGYDAGTAIASCSGVCLKNVTDGEVIDSIVEHNTEHGVSTLDYSTQVDIINCTLRDHDAGYGVEIGLVTLSGDEIPKFINIACNEFYDNFYGIELIGSNCTVKDNLVKDNTEYGIYVFGNGSVIYNNTIENSGNYGIKLYNSSGNLVFWNNFINNNGSVEPQAWDNSVNSNYWNTTIEICYNYTANPAVCCFENYTGNYWSGYTGNDGNNDGIGDNPHNINGGNRVDNHPLIKVMSRLNYTFIRCGDANCDGAVEVADAQDTFNRVYKCRWAANADGVDGVEVGDAQNIFNRVYNCTCPY